MYPVLFGAELTFEDKSSRATKRKLHIHIQVCFASYIFHTILAKSTSCLKWHCVKWFRFPKLRPTVIDVPKYSPAQTGKWTDAHLGDSNKILFLDLLGTKNTFWVP